MRSLSAIKMAEELIKWISRTGIPQEILTNQGSNFMSRILKGVHTTLKLHQLRASIYHLKTDGLVERFYCTLKGVIRACIQGDPRKWE